MNAEIITIGDEILIGQIVDTNSAWMAQQLNLAGISVKQISSVSDDRAHILKALAEARLAHAALNQDYPLLRKLLERNQHLLFPIGRLAEKFNNLVRGNDLKGAEALLKRYISEHGYDHDAADLGRLFLFKAIPALSRRSPERPPIEGHMLTIPWDRPNHPQLNLANL